MKRPELLAPAGDFEKLVTAIHYGADAVYLGSSRFSLRHKADNFELEELKRAVQFTHQKGKRAYVTVNIFPHNRDIALIKEYIGELKSIRPDAIIISDPAVLTISKKVYPELPIHISTQANITNKGAALFWESLGVRRLVLSRELTIGEIKEIRDTVSVEIEVFVHGSICISYSGRCYISSFLASRGANLGHCTNSCRWNYTLMEEKRPNEYMPVFEDDRGTYLMSSKDLCMVEHIDKLVAAGVDSLKIEGRIKGINYVGGVVKVYREAIDSLSPHKPYECLPRWKEELMSVSNRGYTTGMFFGSQPKEDYNFDGTSYRSTRELVGVLTEVQDGYASVNLRHTLKVGDKVEFLTPGLEMSEFEVLEMRDVECASLTVGRNGQSVIIPVPLGVRPLDLVRRRKVGS